MTTWRPVTGFEKSYEVSDSGEIRRIAPRCLMHRKLSDRQLETVHRLLGKGVSQRLISAEVGVSQMIISRIKKGTAYAPHVPKKLVQHLRRDGYPFVMLSVGGKVKNMAVHIAVAQAFIGPRVPGFEVNHKDGIRANSRASNLEYVTPSGNQIHRYDVLNKGHKLTLAQAKEIKSRLRGGESLSKLAKEFSVSKSLVSHISTGRTWNR